MKFRHQYVTFTLATMLLLPISNVMAGWGWKSDSNANHYDHSHYHHEKKRKNKQAVQLGPRPYYLINDLEFSHLKHKLKSCESGPFYKTSFSIGHRGAALQFPEHTKESYEAAARMGAGVVECDVTFTSDRELVCRHSQCDLHTTTNILATDLAAKCSVPFTPADPDKGTAATAKCCTSDITLEEFKSLKGKMDAANSAASSVEEYLNATPAWRTDLYTGEATLMTHRESIELFKKLGVKMTPELKSPSVTMPYLGFYTQEDYAQQMIDEYKAADVAPENVYVQSFNLDDVKYWINNESEFGRQAVYLDGRYDLEEFDHRDPSTWSPSMQALVDDGVEIIAPPMWMLLDVDKAGRIVPSLYAKRAKAAGLDIITWTLERSGVLEAEDGTGGGWYYQTLNGANGSMPVIDNDGDTMVVLDVLAKKVEVLGIFSDWPATVSYYANCMGLK